jgi:hypothetical protein
LSRSGSLSRLAHWKGEPIKDPQLAEALAYLVARISTLERDLLEVRHDNMRLLARVADLERREAPEAPRGFPFGAWPFGRQGS